MCVETLEDTVQPQPHSAPHHALALPDCVLFWVYRLYLMCVPPHDDALANPYTIFQIIHSPFITRMTMPSLYLIALCFWFIDYTACVCCLMTMPSHTHVPYTR